MFRYAQRSFILAFSVSLDTRSIGLGLNVENVRFGSVILSLTLGPVYLSISVARQR
jgi:hypothetical protein